MKIKVYFFGKPNEVTPQEQKHLERISYRAKVELIAFPQAGLKDGAKNKTKEAEALFKKLDNKDFLIVLDERGKSLDSMQFSSQLKAHLVEHSTVCLVIGGAFGLDDSVLKRANMQMSFGAMVWTRNLVRLMLLEQLYRALEIDGGGNFHKN